MAIVSVVSGYVNERSVIEVTPFVFNRPFAGPITPVNDCTFLALMKSREEVNEVCKLGMMHVSTKDGKCSLKVSPWSDTSEACSRKYAVGMVERGSHIDPDIPSGKFPELVEHRSRSVVVERCSHDGDGHHCITNE